MNGAKVYALRDLKPDPVERYLAELDTQGLAPRTINYYLKAAKQMLSWAVHARLIPYSPLECLANRPEHVKHRVRRALSEEEVSRLLAAALEGPARRALRRYRNRPKKDGSYKQIDLPAKVQARYHREGENNVLAYRLMLETGLRRNEVKSLTWADLDLEQGVLTTRPHWEGNKNGREERLPLTPGLLQRLLEWRLKNPGDPSVKVVKLTSRSLRAFDEDLVAAGLATRVPQDREGKPIPLNAEGLPVRTPCTWVINKRDAAGRVLDMHALRHTFGTRLGRLPGVDPKTVQSLMRHSDPRLTFGVYVHSDAARLKAAVQNLPTLEPQNQDPPDEAQQASAGA